MTTENLPNIVPLADAVLCVSCTSVSDSRGEVCVACGAAGSLMNISRILNPQPELGRITYLFAGESN
jgi:hypothetical protein